MTIIDDIWAYLFSLEQIIAAVPSGSLSYAEATALFNRLDALAVSVEERLVCAAPDYPDESDNAN